LRGIESVSAAQNYELSGYADDNYLKFGVTHLKSEHKSCLTMTMMWIDTRTSTIGTITPE
jgi:hypothetical protein